MKLTVATSAALAIALTACGGSKPASSPPTTTLTQPASAAAGASAAASSREVALVSGVRPLIDNLTDALRRGDAAASRAALEAYDLAWNGIEVYVNVRSKDPRYLPPGQEDLYAALEVDLQAKLTEGLAANPPAFTTLVPLSEQLAKKYDAAIARSQAGPPLSPLFDDVATVRIARAGLREATSALAANDATKAKAAFSRFQSAYPPVQAIVRARSIDAERETTAAITAAGARFGQAPPASVAELTPVVATVTDRYNYGLRLVNAAARNADPSQTAATDDHLGKLRTLNGVKTQLKASLTAWTAGEFTKATTSFRAANDAYNQVQPALAAKASDADPTKTLAAFGAFVGAPGDTVKVTAAHKTAVESMAVAEQVLAGQFWTDKKVQDFVASLPAS